jgi:pSer/pThr/pTyr-binding forkhead associated (FHA) protein
MSSAGHDVPAESLLAKHRCAVVILSGATAGAEIELRQLCTVFGRGPGVDVTLADEAMSRQHFALELGPVGFRVRDLGSTNGVLVNGKKADAAILKHGDRIRAGGHEFQLLIEELEREPPTYLVSD